MDLCKHNDYFSLNTCDDLSQYKKYEDSLYEIFQKLYLNANMHFNSVKVKLKFYPPHYDKESLFYHLICENYVDGDEKDRTPARRRCERLHWIREILDSCVLNCKEILIWKNKRNTRENIVIYCSELRYLVILEVRGGYYLLKTAYNIEYDTRHNKLIKEYNDYKKQTAP